jgi:hypothetical protein
MRGVNPSSATIQPAVAVPDYHRRPDRETRPALSAACFAPGDEADRRRAVTAHPTSHHKTYEKRTYSASTEVIRVSISSLLQLADWCERRLHGSQGGDPCTTTITVTSAIVYVRQSSATQVLENRESTARQYALVERAVQLGWAAVQVEVIDEDQGRSGSTAEGRLGFQRLLAEVSLDHVGIVLGIEMSRLARSNKDWHQLLELCAIFRTLLADQDGLYATDYNDRLLLGLKGTMSEAELLERTGGTGAAICALQPDPSRHSLRTGARTDSLAITKPPDGLGGGNLFTERPEAHRSLAGRARHR